MRTHGHSERIAVTLLGLLLASCSATRSTAPDSDAQLTGLVLIIQEAPDGGVTASWRSATGFALPKHLALSGGPLHRIVLAMNRERD